MGETPAWVHWCALLSLLLTTAALTAVAGDTGHLPANAAANFAEMAVVLWMVRHIVAVATRHARPLPAERQCAMMRVVGRHDGEPCASCELERATTWSRGRA